MSEEQLKKAAALLRSRKYKNLDEGWALAEEVLQIGQQRNEDSLQGLALNTQAEILYLRSEAPEKVYAVELRAIQHEKDAGDIFGLYSSYNMLGIQDTLLNARTRAIDHFMTSLEYGEQLDEEGRVRRGVLYFNLATVYRSLRDFRQALEFCQQGLPLLKLDTGNPHWYHNLIGAYALLGLLFLETKPEEQRPEEAAICCQKIVEMTQQYPDRQNLSDSPYYDYLLLQAKLARAQHDPAAEAAALDQEIDSLARNGIMSDGIDSVADFMDYLIQIQEWDRFLRFGGVFQTYIERLTPAHHIRWLSDCLQYELETGQEEKARKTALQYYNAVMEQQMEMRSTELQAAKSRILLHHARLENQKLSREAETDELTGLPNRYKLNTYSDQLFEHAYHHQQHLAAEIMDIDYFKQLNDSRGHHAGDECLRQIGKVLQDFTAKYPAVFAARYGGDEFTILYDNMTDEEVMACAEEIRSTIEALQISNPASPSGCVSISQGIRNSVPKEGNKLWDFLSAADNALYQVKKTHKGEIMLIRKTKIDEHSFENAQLS